MKYIPQGQVVMQDCRKKMGEFCYPQHGFLVGRGILLPELRVSPIPLLIRILVSNGASIL
jgi:hypothetical protein